MSNEEIVIQIQNGINVQENMQILYKQNECLIRKVVFPFTERAELDDLMQEAYFGIVDAVNDFDATMDYKFMTYAPWKIRKHCLAYIKKQGSANRIPDYMQSRINKYKHLMKELNGVPDKETVMERLNISSDQYDLLIMTIRQLKVSSLDAEFDEDGNALGELISDGTDIESDCILKDSCNELWKCVEECLDDKSNDIIVKHFRNNQTLTSIASEKGLTHQRVQQIKDKALSELRELHFLQELSEVWGYDSYKAYSGSFHSVENLAIKRVEIDEKQKILQEIIGINNSSLENEYQKLIEKLTSAKVG